MKTNKIPDEDLAWLQAHKQSVEHRDRTLKGTGVFFYYFVIYLVAPISFAFALLSTIAAVIAGFILVGDIILIAFSFPLPSVIDADKYIKQIATGFTSGLIVGLIIAIVYIAPTASISQYPISMQVFYPNHPNITITQNCTGFTTSESGYLNGQPINLTNTTQCNLPERMAQYEYNPFNCNIAGKNITCIAALDAHVTWQGTILNVSKR